MSNSFSTIKKHLKEAFGVHIKRPNHIHHIDCNPKNNNILNLVALSDFQHKQVHEFIKREEKLIKKLNYSGRGLKDSRTIIRFLNAKKQYGNIVNEIINDVYYTNFEKYSKLLTWTKPNINHHKRIIEREKSLKNNPNND